MNTQSTTKTNKIIIIGGGAAGMMAAIAAADNAAVTVIERNQKLGMKLNITGKGRCNLTNNCDVRTLTENVPTNPKFLYKAFSAFPPSAIMEFFESNGLPLKTERGRRVFPQSDSAFDVTDTLRKVLREKNVRIMRGKVTGILVENGVCNGVVVDGKQTLYADRVIVAAGGASYPRTGSDGSAYKLCSDIGHTVTPLKPSLVPLTSSDKCCAKLMGLALKNVSVSFFKGEKLVFSDFGEMLFTHFGVSGPIILSASAYVKSFPARMTIDLKPALDDKTLDNRIVADFSSEKNRIFANSLGGLLPRALIPVIIERSKIDPKKQVNSVTREERKTLVNLIHNFEIELNGTRPLDEAIITSGGISVKEINPSTMESKLIKGLYFAGEIIDVDAYTGGYNLTIAFATGHLAGTSALS